MGNHLLRCDGSKLLRIAAAAVCTHDATRRKSLPVRTRLRGKIARRAAIYLRNGQRIFIRSYIRRSRALITSPLLSTVPGIVHGFGTAQELVPVVLQDAWEQRPDKTQVHGVATAQVTAVAQLCGEVDGLYSSTAGIPVSVITADCVPILLARRDGKMVAALHAGWRGLYAGLIEALWVQLRARGEQPADWIASVGPAIGPCCYEVSEELAQQFQDRFAAMPAPQVLPAHRHLDLPRIAGHALQAAGVDEVEVLRHCTRCSFNADGTGSFRSYRRGDRGSQQHAGLMIVPAAA
jgi:YfiH family protein